ncbi:hypothetical protein DQ393_10155 [Rhizobium tropici]|uniref:Uncharacterized protein n=1 Tax=Rhizobium tropici TaxID=398 RepID=A0A329YM43_RHITR|nr:hypothetical protein DQ393_10155 [Rhizobium tropici]
MMAAVGAMATRVAHQIPVGDMVAPTQVADHRLMEGMVVLVAAVLRRPMAATGRAAVPAGLRLATSIPVLWMTRTLKARRQGPPPTAVTVPDAVRAVPR